MATKNMGRHPRAHDPRVPHLSSLLAGRDLEAPPPEVDWTRGMPRTLGMMLNDRLDCCTCAAYFHARQVWTFHTTGELQTQPDADVERLYILARGYDPRKDGIGPGGSAQQVLTFLHKHGAPIGADGKGRDRLEAFVEVDPRMVDDVKHAIAACGTVYAGLNLPHHIAPSPQAVPPPVWDVEPDDPMLGGHAVVLAGYGPEGLKVISWGGIFTMTWAFFAKYAEEVYALADADWVTEKGTTPAGLSLEALEAQMEGLREKPVSPG